MLFKKGEINMIFWQHDASKELDRLAIRLMKYKGGQILINTKGETLRGAIIDYEETGAQINFSLLWLAKKRIVSNSSLCSKWKWELTHEPTSKISCAITIELVSGEEKGPKSENLSAEMLAHVELKKFYQNKQWKKWGLWGIVYPKCLFFSTKIPGERGTLFQPHDPRNLKLEGENIIDPYAPPIPPKRR